MFPERILQVTYPTTFHKHGQFVPPHVRKQCNQLNTLVLFQYQVCSKLKPTSFLYLDLHYSVGIYNVILCWSQREQGW